MFYWGGYYRGQLKRRPSALSNYGNSPYSRQMWTRRQLMPFLSARLLSLVARSSQTTGQARLISHQVHQNWLWALHFTDIHTHLRQAFIRASIEYIRPAVRPTESFIGAVLDRLQYAICLKWEALVKWHSRGCSASLFPRNQQRHVSLLHFTHIAVLPRAEKDKHQILCPKALCGSAGTVNYFSDPETPHRSSVNTEKYKNIQKDCIMSSKTNINKHH